MIPVSCTGWLAVGHTDLRRGMNRLAIQVQVLKRIRIPVIFLSSGGKRGTWRHSATFRSEPWEPKGFILLKAIVEIWATADDFACRGGLGFERGEGICQGADCISCVAGSTPPGRLTLKGETERASAELAEAGA
jgi:hypothetical protein